MNRITGRHGDPFVPPGHWSIGGAFRKLSGGRAQRVSAEVEVDGGHWMVTMMVELDDGQLLVNCSQMMGK